MRKTRRAHFQLDTTPMTDTVFLLLIFFTLSSSFVVQPGIKIKLPAAVTSELDLTKIIVVDVTREGRIFFNGRSYSLDDLPRALAQELVNVTEKKVIIKADKDVRHGIVVKIMDIAKLSGAEKLVIGTEPASSLK